MVQIYIYEQNFMQLTLDVLNYERAFTILGAPTYLTFRKHLGSDAAHTIQFLLMKQ